MRNQMKELTLASVARIDTRRYELVFEEIWRKYKASFRETVETEVSLREIYETFERIKENCEEFFLAWTDGYPGPQLKM